MSITMNGIDVPNAIVDLEFRVIQLELIAQALMNKLPTSTFSKEETANINIKAKQRFHNKYPFVKIED